MPVNRYGPLVGAHEVEICGVANLRSVPHHQTRFPQEREMNQNNFFRRDRRTFLKNAGGLAVFGMLPGGIARAAVDDDFNNLLLFADFEQATFEEALQAQDRMLLDWQRSQCCHFLSTQHARRGSKSFQSKMTNGGGHRRAEILGANQTADGLNHRWNIFDTHWYGFSVYIPSPWQESTCWELIHQLHGSPPSSYENHWSRNPWFAIFIGNSLSSSPNHYGIRIRYCPVWMGESSRDDVRTGYYDDSISMLPDVGKWTDWVVQYRPDYRPNTEGGNGLTRVWKDGKLIVDYQGPNYDNQDRGPYVKFGLYKGDWAGGRADDPVQERSYYYDEIRVSRANVGSYELVTPRGNRSVVPPESPAVEVE